MLNWFDMDYKNQAVSKDLSLAEIKLILISVIVVIIIKKEIKNFERESVIYIILITSKYGILLELGRLQGICLVILSFA